MKGQAPAIERPDQRQPISAASAVTARGAFWHAACEGGLSAELFVGLLRWTMRNRIKPVRLAVDGSAARKTALAKACAASTDGRLTLHVLPGCAPDP